MQRAQAAPIPAPGHRHSREGGKNTATPAEAGGQTRLNGAVGSSGPDFQPGLNEKEIFQEMNTQVGKSIGIALLLAAGLLAALFAMGVFSASGVGAHDGDVDDPVHDLLDSIGIVADATETATPDGQKTGGTEITLNNMDRGEDNANASATGFDADSHEYSINVLPQQRVLYVRACLQSLQD